MLKLKRLIFVAVTLFSSSSVPLVIADDSMTAWEPQPNILFTTTSRELIEVETQEKVSIFINFSDKDTWTKFLPGQSEGGKSEKSTLGRGAEDDRCTVRWEKDGGKWSWEVYDYIHIWQAPKEPGLYTIKIFVADTAPVVDLGHRDDENIEATILINVRPECGGQAMTDEQECCKELRTPRPYSFKTECCSPGGIFSKFTIDDLLDCPHRVPRVGYGPVISNGCSVPFALSFFVSVAAKEIVDPNNPAGARDTHFSNYSNGPCDNHDYCWGTCSGPGSPNAYMSRCDDAFLAQMLGVCRASKNPFARGKCEVYAKLYYQAVERFGGKSNFIPGQKKACQCCD